VNSTKDIEKYLTTEDLGNLGSFLEPIINQSATNITQVITVFGIFLSLYGIFFFVKVYSDINNIKKSISENIKHEVTNQIAYSVYEISDKVENHAYKKIDHSIQQIKDRVQQKLFEYQEFIYKVNQTKKLKYEKIIHDKTISVENMLKEMTAIQGHYNEICNHYAPKLFSDNIEDDLLPTAKNLADEKDLHHVLIKYLLKVYKDEDKLLQYHEKSKIKTILIEEYKLKEDDFKE
jgi:hypothetical protein